MSMEFGNVTGIPEVDGSWNQIARVGVYRDPHYHRAFSFQSHDHGVPDGDGAGSGPSGNLHQLDLLDSSLLKSGLDPGARRDLWQYLHILREQERVTVIVTTHLMEEAERCDRLAILSEGKLVALGTPAELKREIGGDVILLEATDPESLARRIHGRYRLDATVIAGKVRLERESGHRFVTDVVEAFPGEIQSMSVSKPTLEDVFIHRTGHRFWTEGQQTEEQRAAENKGADD
jgi:ABC-type sulfate/molybdate transport systems ATPase subunit